ncbi:hypothetical protein [Photorhabdus akhurstii]|nr:hypothetical protein [Photorhabdus akhurstii]
MLTVIQPVDNYRLADLLLRKQFFDDHEVVKFRISVVPCFDIID